MSIATAISALQSASSDIASAIAAKGVTVPSGSGFDDYASLIASIPQDGGGGGSSDPELPSGYTRKSYIYGNGSAYINTGVSGAMTWHIIAQADSGQTTKYFVGNGTSVGQSFGITSQGTIGVSTTSGQNAGSGLSSSAKVNFSISFLSNMSTGAVNNYSIYRSGNISRTGTYGLFASTSTGDNKIAAKIWQADGWNNNGVAFHGIPCTNANGVAGLYDTVSQTFFGSSTDTPFTSGD